MGVMLQGDGDGLSTGSRQQDAGENGTQCEFSVLVKSLGWHRLTWGYPVAACDNWVRGRRVTGRDYWVTARGHRVAGRSSSDEAEVRSFGSGYHGDRISARWCRTDTDLPAATETVLQPPQHPARRQ